MYKMTKYWEEKLYIGITLKWNYTKRMEELSITGYVEAALYEFQHPKPSRPQQYPYPSTSPIYGSNSQLTTPPYTTPTLSPEKLPDWKEWLVNSYIIFDPLMRPCKSP